jgi:hypothetical protein
MYQRGRVFAYVSAQYRTHVSLRHTDSRLELVTGAQVTLPLEVGKLETEKNVYQITLAFKKGKAPSPAARAAFAFPGQCAEPSARVGMYHQ